MSAAYKVSSAFVGGTGRHTQKYVRLLKLNPLSSYYYKDNFGSWVTSYVCHPTVFHVVYFMANCNSDKDQMADQSYVTQTTSIRTQEMQHPRIQLEALGEDRVLWCLT